MWKVFFFRDVGLSIRSISTTPLTEQKHRTNITQIFILKQMTLFQFNKFIFYTPYYYQQHLRRAWQGDNSLYDKTPADEGSLTNSLRINTFYRTRISETYGPSILAVAESWLASLTSCFATLNFMRGLRPLQFLLSPTFLRCKDIHMNG